MPDVWVYTHPRNGVISLLQEILRCCRIEGSLTALSNVLQVIGGPCVAEGDGLRVVKGSPTLTMGRPGD